MKTYDDERKPETTRLNTEKLLKEDNALALFGCRSSLMRHYISGR